MKFLTAFILFLALHQALADVSLEPGDVRMLFVIGKPSNKTNPSAKFKFDHPSAVGKNVADIMEGLMWERLLYKDLLEVDAIDHYGKNVTIKMYAAYRWALAACPSMKYLQKIDEDMVLDINRLKFWIRYKFEKEGEKTSGGRTIFGRLIIQQKPKRMLSSKYHAPFEEFPGDVFPPYAITPLFKRRALIALLKHTPKVKSLRLEDTMNGIVAEAANVTFVSAYEHYNMNRPLFNESEKVNCTRDENGVNVPETIIISFPNSTDAYGNYEKLKNLKCLENNAGKNISGGVEPNFAQ